MIVFGCYGSAPTNWKAKNAIRARIRTAAKRGGLDEPSFDQPDFHQALVVARQRMEEGHQVAIVGPIDALVPPDVGQSTWTAAEWREAWLHMAREEGITYLPVLDGSSIPVDQSGDEVPATARQSIIRRYQAACSGLRRYVRRLKMELAKEHATRERGYAGGRPPYGYRVEQGQLVVHNDQANAVRLIFKLAATGKHSVSDICRMMKAHSPDQFWDGVKVRRILGHAKLYASGSYEASTGTKLPAARRLILINTEVAALATARLQNARRPASRLPSRSRTGTMEATRT